MPRAKIPEGELVNFIVKTRTWSNQTTDFQKNLGLIRNLANKVFRDYVGYTMKGAHRIKERGEAVFASELARDARRQDPAAGGAAASTRLRYLGDGAFAWVGSLTVILGVPRRVRSLSRVDFLVADRFSPEVRESIAETLRTTGATLLAPPRAAAHFASVGLRSVALTLGGHVADRGLAVHAVPCLTSEEGEHLGFVAEMDGAVVYHAGRTTLTSEMRTAGDLFRIDALLLPLGLTRPLSVWAAALAAEWAGARWVLPWAAEPGVFAQDLQKHLGDLARVSMLGPNEEFELTLE